MKTVQLSDHVIFSMRGPMGEYEIDVFFSADWRVTELCIAGEDEAEVNEFICQAAITQATAMSKLAQAQLRGDPPNAIEVDNRDDAADR
jgi:hypothetical protein